MGQRLSRVIGTVVRSIEFDGGYGVLNFRVGCGW